MYQLQPTGFRWSTKLRQDQPTGLHWRALPKWLLADEPEAIVARGQAHQTSNSEVAGAGSAHLLARRNMRRGEPV